MRGHQPFTQQIRLSDDTHVSAILIFSSTKSLTSSINEYFIENGRQYHQYFGEDKNPMPTDEIEQDRLDLHHEVFLQLLDGKLHLAPIENPKNILDVGTGTGIWAIEMADKYPAADVIGTDLSPIQPQWVPVNCRFEVDDAELDWTFPPNSFDFIHVRNLQQSIGDWPRLMTEIYRATKPGGWVELAECSMELFSDDNTLPPNFKRFTELINEALTKLGRPQEDGAGLRERLKDAGFVDLRGVALKQPAGPWPKDEKMKAIGRLGLLNAESGISAYGMAVLTRNVGMNVEEATKLCDDSLAEITNYKNYHVYSLL
ncbi:S-adenosyl-L-methionine-dependent methyltransferase [Wilcoxina mikolae CBS 423.85]|nr:S-adenosyl-L-methionine-dependent methyltransferase [Wilcoxina mikolae CBS 423.85]